VSIRTFFKFAKKQQIENCCFFEAFLMRISCALQQIL
jgi:hypothetical protein